MAAGAAMPGGAEGRLRESGFLAAAVGLLAVMAATPGMAQPVPPTPGSIQESIGPARPASPSTAPAPVLPAPDKAAADPSEKKFLVNAIQFTGNSAVSTEELQAFVKDQVGKPLNLYDLHKIAEAITDLYRKKGYVLARAIVPAQRVDNGIVRIEIIEGRVGKVSVVGNQRYSTAAIGRFMSRLQDDRPVIDAGLERSLLLLNDLPGITARGVFQPGAQYGTADLEIQIEEKPVAGSLSLNNHGRKEVGALRLEGSADVNNPFGLGDQLSLRAIRSEQGLLDYGRVAYSLPVNADGMRLAASYAEVDYDVRGNFAALGIDGRARITELTVSHPYLRSRAENLVVGGGLRANDTRQRALGVEISRTHITLLTASALYSRIHPDVSVTNATLAFSGNFKRNPDGTRQDAARAKLDADVTHLRPLTATWDLYLRGAAVLSADALPDTEKFSLGGPGNVRGIPAAEIRGDQGLLGSAEFRRRFALGGLPAVFSVFADAGQVQRKRPAAGIDRTDSLSSVGFGVSFFPHKQFGAKVEYARPTNNRTVSDGRNNGRWWVNLTASF